ncbi:hypothetical protein ACJ3XI_04330 [Litorimonas sp. RW-G-Af-16]|uniref:hypothetical protein n=1 Tax=Litorimonas sp. RW-G-Af-16 TaxID=3241168 RepID=UPI00390C5CA1
MIRNFVLLTIGSVWLTACASSPMKEAGRIVDRSETLAVKTATEKSQAENVERVGDTQTLGDAVLTPLSDVNLKKQAIPPKLANMTNPYARFGTARCEDIQAEVLELNNLLGRDFDQDGYDEADMETLALNATSSVVGGLIPFRGLIRSATGANEYDREVQRAYRRGVTRRAFLKGVAVQKGCN